MFDFIIKGKIKKLNSKKRERKYKGLSELQSILVLFETSDYEYADHFIEKLSSMKKEVRGCGFRVINDDKIVYSKTSSYIIIPKLDTNKAGIPNEKLLNSLVAKKYDVIIDLTINENYTMEYILAFLDTPLKVGLKKNDMPLYDISISGLQDNIPKASQLGEQILYSLNAISSKV